MEEQNSEPKGATNTAPAAQPKSVVPPKPAETVSVTTPAGHEVVMKGYISGGDMDELQRQILENTTFKASPSGEVETNTPEMKGTFLLDRTRKALELLLISVDGSTEDPVQAVRNLPVEDYDAVVEKVNEVSGPLPKAPKTS